MVEEDEEEEENDRALALGEVGRLGDVGQFEEEKHKGDFGEVLGDLGEGIDEIEEGRCKGDKGTLGM